MFVSHRPRARDPLLWAKVACLLIGGLLGLFGMRRHSAVLINVAIVVVLVGFALRFVRRHAAVAGLGDPAPDGESPAPDP